MDDLKKARSSGRGKRKTTSAIKDPQHLAEIADYLERSGQERIAELFRIGCNVALRIGDLLTLTFEDIDNLQRSEIREQKTGKFRNISFNAAALESVEILRQWYIDRGLEPVHLFRSMHRAYVQESRPFSRNTVSEWLKQAQEDLDLPYNINTHSLRKTFGYTAYTQNKVPIEVLQKLFNHGSAQTTLRYIGIEEETISQVYLDTTISIPRRSRPGAAA